MSWLSDKDAFNKFKNSFGEETTPVFSTPKEVKSASSILEPISNRVIIGMSKKHLNHPSGADFRGYTSIIITGKGGQDDSQMLNHIFQDIPGGCLLSFDFNTYLLRFSPVWKNVEVARVLDLISDRMESLYGRTVERRLGYPGILIASTEDELPDLDSNVNYDVVNSFTTSLVNYFPKLKESLINSSTRLLLDEISNPETL